MNHQCAWLLTIPEGNGATPSLFEQGIHWVVRATEVAGVSIIVFGAIVASAIFLRRFAAGDGFMSAYHAYRGNLGRAILLGLEFLVAADIIDTVAVEPTIRNVAVLGLIVLIRTFLSFSLEVEILGRWPWQMGDASESQKEEMV